MGINKQVLKMLLVENEYKRLYGKILLVGRSTVNIRSEDLYMLLDSFGIKAQLGALETQVTKHQSDLFPFDDKELFRVVSPEIESIDVLDVSDYEGANIVWDLNYPVPDELFSKYDFIYDSSVLDNIFNPAEGITNFSKMLKASGRYLGTNVSSFFPGAMVSCHPQWFYSFFSMNNYEDVKVYLTSQEDNKNEAGQRSRFEYITNLFGYKPTFTPSLDYDYFEAVRTTNTICYSIVIAEKSNVNSIVRYPVNLQYLVSSNSPRWDTRDFIDSNQRGLNACDTRLFNKMGDDIPTLPHLTDHYFYIGSGF